MLNFNSLLVFSDNPQKLADFYQKVFGKNPEWTGGDFTGWMVGSGFFTIGPHDKVHGMSKQPERLIFNFETEEVEKEFDRLKNLGAKVVKAPYHPMEEEEMLLATFSDPDGNYFQLASPMKM